jgi:hypothetical protein
MPYAAREANTNCLIPRSRASFRDVLCAFDVHLRDSRLDRQSTDGRRRARQMDDAS